MFPAYAFRFRWLAFIVLLMAGAAPAVRAEGSIERLLDVSGLRHTLEQLPGLIVTTLDVPQPDVDIPPQIRVAMKDATRQAFGSGALLATARDHLQASLSEPQIAAAIAFFETPLGRKLVRLERELADPAAAGAFEAYVVGLASRPPGRERVRLIEAYDAATGSSDAVMAVMESTALSVALALNASQSRQTQSSPQDLRRRIREALPDIEAQARLHVLASVLYTYRGLDDADFARYVRFLEAPAGTGYARASARLFQRVMTESMGRLMQALPMAIERARGSARI